MKKCNWVEDGLSPHNGEYWYKCKTCGATDWIASYGTMSQLNGGKKCKQAQSLQQNRADVINAGEVSPHHTAST